MSGRQRRACCSVPWRCLVLLVAAAGCSNAPYMVNGPGGPSTDGEAVAAAMALLLGPSPWPESAVEAAPPVDLDALARAIHDRVNAVRVAHGLRPLQWSDRLAVLAHAHSTDMARHAYFDHFDRQGEDATQRALRTDLGLVTTAGSYEVENVGENLFLTRRFSAYARYDAGGGRTVYAFQWKTLDQMARQTVEGWMLSPSHRANLLYPAYMSEGIGVAFGRNATVFVTQNLLCARPGRLADGSLRHVGGP